MDLILWRHAEAEEGGPDLERALTAKGRKQAARVAEWLQQRLPAKFTLLASPAVRAQQTASALGTPITEKSLAPGASVAAIAKAAEKYKGVVIVVGHQPDLGRAAAQLVANARAEWSIEKGALWWLAGDAPARIKAVVSADLL